VELSSRWLSGMLSAACVAAAVASASACGEADESSLPRCDESSTTLFEERVLPLLVDDQPKSCNQCHLSGIDLAAIVRDDPCEAMACLVADRLVDLSHPERSTILEWIRRADSQSELITEEVIELEYQSFLEWIELEARCRSCAGTPCGRRENPTYCQPVDTPKAATDTSSLAGDCSDKALEQLFLETVYASRGRCYPCHFTTNSSIADAPKWIEQEGSCEAASLMTMRNVIQAGYVDLEEPARSLLLIKPLAERDGGVPHGGHDKFRIEGDPSYENFLAWVTEYAACERSSTQD